MAQALVMLLVVLSSATAYAQRPPVPGPDPEVGPGRGPETKIALPAIPAFDVPTPEPGFENVKGLRVAGHAKLDTDIVVKGYVIWIYDCVDTIRRRRESKAQAQRRIEADPTLCERKKFYLGQTRHDGLETGLWVVDVPRPPNKLERERLPKEEIDNWPAVPTLKVGEYVAVSGRFTLASPHDERNSDGLLVFKSIAPATPPSSSKTTAASKPRPVVAAPAIKQWIDQTSDAAKDRSVKLSNEGTRAYGAKQYDTAAELYTQAVAAWPGNHVAYYGLAGSYIGKKEWAAAAAAMEKAIEIEPAQAMYHMVRGYTLYERGIAEARARGKLPTTANHDQALVHLSHAVKLEPKLWRAHYYIGRIYRDRGDAKWAVESLDAALRSLPKDPAPYIALAELYRRWDYPNEALTVAMLGTQNVPDALASSDVWYVAGMAYDDKNDFPKAIEAYSKSIAANRDNAKALFQRGQDYFRTRDNKKARRDLEAFVKRVNGNGDTFAVQQANKILLDLGAK